MTTKTVSYITKSKSGGVDVRDYDYNTEDETCTLTPQNLLSFDEILEDLPNRMDSGTTRELKNTSQRDLIKYHMGLGMWMRNSYGLWQPDNHHVGEEHPDDYSFRIIEQFWENLNSADNKFDKAMEVLNDD